MSVFVQTYVYKSPGPDRIHPRILYETRSIVAAPLRKYLKPHYYLQNFLTIGESSENISAIHKNGNKSELCNYRPVTLTCFICKLMEKEVIEITYPIIFGQ